MGDRERQVVFVTVGTTCFDALVKAVDSKEVKDALLQKGYTDLLIQMGQGFLRTHSDKHQGIVSQNSYPIGPLFIWGPQIRRPKLPFSGSAEVKD